MGGSLVANLGGLRKRGGKPVAEKNETGKVKIENGSTERSMEKRSSRE
jgi:hypothetical protein